MENLTVSEKNFFFDSCFLFQVFETPTFAKGTEHSYQAE